MGRPKKPEPNPVEVPVFFFKGRKKRIRYLVSRLFKAEKPDPCFDTTKGNRPKYPLDEIHEALVEYASKCRRAGLKPILTGAQTNSLKKIAQLSAAGILLLSSLYDAFQ